jgi:hypothetical protein
VDDYWSGVGRFYPLFKGNSRRSLPLSGRADA